MLRQLFGCPRRKAAPRWADSSTWAPFEVALYDSAISRSGLRERFDALRFKTVKISGSKITYIPLLEVKEQFNLCMFYLPHGARLPWHNHPQQHVFVKVLAGSLKIQSADCDNTTKLALHEPILLDPDTGSHLVEPERNNIHQITALTDSLFLDLVMPPYSAQRAITYYVPTGDNEFKAVSEHHVQLDMDLADIHALV